MSERGKTTFKDQVKNLLMKPRTVNYKRAHISIDIKKKLFRASLRGKQSRAKFFKRGLWDISARMKVILVFAIVAILLVSVFAFMPKASQTAPAIEPISNDPTASPSPTSQQTPSETDKPKRIPNIGNPIINMIQQAVSPKAPGLIEAAITINSTVWKSVAANAWRYFQPDIGVDRNTGLPRGNLDFHCFTDWDLGVYIQTVIDAQKIGLISKNETWGSTDRLERVVTFLENRKLNNATGYPFWFYQAADGKNFKRNSDFATVTVDVVDTGRLFVALNNLKAFDSRFALRIDNFVHNRSGNRSDYAVLVPSIKSDSLISTSIYAYYFYSGFASFFPEIANAPDSILNRILASETVPTYNVPKADILCDPLLSSVFELKKNPNLMDLARRVYLAHETKYNETGEFVAFSEGNGYNTFIYEWVVLSNGDTWKVKQIDYSDFRVNPIIYTKVAFSFLALYNTTYARDAVVYLERSLPDPTNGYNEGADFNTDSNNRYLVTQVGSNTNGMIISAARYALQPLVLSHGSGS